MKTTKYRLIIIGGLLMLLGAGGFNTNIAFGGVLGWVLMLAGVVVIIVGATRKS
jgi:hypothetical protein